MEQTRRKWSGYWINSGEVMIEPVDYIQPAPFLCKSFSCTKKPEKAVIYLCTPGWHELYVNGQKADDRVLAPAVTQFDRRVSYIEYDVTGLLKQGENTVSVLLGNGWYNHHTPSGWNFDYAPWRDWPKMLCDIEADGAIIAKSDTSWQVCESAVIFDSLRNGERYDARREMPLVMKNAVQTTPPGGIIVKEDLEPCKVMKEYAPVSVKQLSGGQFIYDFGTNLTGWCAIEVRGDAGNTVRLEYGEDINMHGDLVREKISKYTKGKDGFQEDCHTLKGGAVESFRPRFTYHGFRYVRVSLIGRPRPELLGIKAQFVHNSFAQTGSVSSSCSTLNRLQEITVQSYLSNFTGIPTDCPHREKNGWTGDANMACETGLWNFDSGRAYIHFLRMMADAQRPGGQLPGIVPTGGWGYNWGNGPAWDSMLFEGVWQIWRFCGKTDHIEEFYEPMRRYVEYCRSMSENNLVRFGLGDWCHWDNQRMAPAELTSSCYFYSDTLRLAEFAKMLGKTEDCSEYSKLASDIKTGFIERFYNGDGTYGNRVMTALAAPLFFGLAAENPEITAGILAETVRNNGHKADFGILGAKYVPRVLAQYGYADDAYILLTQNEFPGWGYWVAQGATTLWENWSGTESRNHIMFGDISAWLYEFPGGLSPVEPGFRRFRYKPCIIKALSRMEAKYGKITCRWQREPDRVCFHIEVPENMTCEFHAPGGKISVLPPGIHDLSC